MPTHEHRFTDAHVRADPGMYEALVIEYLQHYTGEFELLLSYKLRLDAGERLTVPMIRATLNCMRFDAQVVGLPEPHAPLHVVDERHLAKVLNFERQPRRRTPRRPNYIDLPTRWKMRYGISHWVTACRVHIVHPDSVIRYIPATGEYDCRLHWACKTPWGMSRLDIVELVTDDDAQRILASPGWQLCGTCAIRED